MGIEPTLSAWEAEVLPLNYTRMASEGVPLNQAHSQSLTALCVRILHRRLCKTHPITTEGNHSKPFEMPAAEKSGKKTSNADLRAKTWRRIVELARGISDGQAIVGLNHRAVDEVALIGA